jgi:hypothetical protein
LRITIILFLLIIGCSGGDGNEPCEPDFADAGLFPVKAFGYMYPTMYLWTDALDEISDHTNLAHLSYPWDEELLDYATIEHEFDILLSVGWIFFDWNRGSIRSDWPELWEENKPLIEKYQDFIIGFYVVDEPDIHDFSTEEQGVALNALKTDFPDIDTWVTFADKDVEMGIHPLYNYVSITPRYSSWNVCDYADRIDKLIDRLLPHQMAWIIGDGFHQSPEIPEWKENQKAEFLWDWYGYATSEPRIDAILVFLWSDQTNLGVKEMPVVLDAAKKIGDEIL